MELDPLEQAVLDKWGSEEAVYVFLERELEQINAQCFHGHLSLPRLQLKPMWLAKGLLGGEPFRGGDYDRATSEKPAEIGLFPVALVDKDRARIVLAHEMIHHWEVTTEEESDDWSYPSEVDEIIRQRFSGTMRERSWRAGHSIRFISKTCEVARCLDIPVGHLLFSLKADQ